MLEILKFVLSDFWVWCGTIGLLLSVGSVVAMIVNALPGGKRQVREEQEHERETQAGS